MKSFFFLISIMELFFISCLNKTQNIDHNAIENKQKKERLGSTNYYIALPENINLEEVHGKEGYLGYNVIPKDGSLRFLGTIEIKEGHPIGESSGEDINKIIDSIYADFLGTPSLWIVEQTPTKYFEAHIPKNNKVSVFAKNRMDVDTVINILTTLVQK